MGPSPALPLAAMGLHSPGPMALGVLWRHGRLCGRSIVKIRTDPQPSAAVGDVPRAPTAVAAVKVWNLREPW